MPVLIVYVCEIHGEVRVCNASGYFKNYPPTLEVIRGAEKEIRNSSEKIAPLGKVCIVNWLPLSESPKQ